MEGIVGSLNWSTCEYCKHYRPDKGGCEPLDTCSVQGEILEMNINWDQVSCTQFTPAKALAT